MARPEFSPEQARVIAALVEKSLTTPQYYPMTVNAITAACNQKSCRRPVMQLSEGAVGAALNALEADGYCRRVENSGRTVKWRHQFKHQMLLENAPVALLVTLMLRGPQTASELRANAAGLKGPADGEELAACLERLTDGPDPLVVLLPRAAGQKEARYAHCLSGEPEFDATPAPARASEPIRPPDGEDELRQRIAALEARVAALETAAATTIEQTGDTP